MIHNRVTAFVFRLASFVFVLIGLSTHINIFGGKANLTLFMYYTIQSNLLALLMFGILTVKTATELLKNGKKGHTSYFARFEMICVIDLLLTLIVYWVMLAPGAFSMGGDHGLFHFGNLSVHLISPLLCLIDYILFTDSKQLKYRDVYYVLIYPLSYVLFTSITGFMGYVYRIDAFDGKPVHFPYFFFDYERIGLKSFMYIGVLVLFFLVLSHGLYFLDKKVRKPVLIGNK